MTLDEIRAAFPGYHVTVNLFPSGGDLEAWGCEECGTDDETFFSAGWRTRRGESERDAARTLQKRIDDSKEASE